MKTAIVGRGKAGTHIYNRLKSIGAECTSVDSRTLEGLPQDAAVVVLAVSDGAVEEVAARLQGHPGILAHVSGSLPTGALGQHCRKGVVYPLQSFSPATEPDWDGIPLFVNASDPDTLKVLTSLALQLGPNVRHLDDEGRRLLHIAGVMAGNFVNEMIAAAEEVMQQAGLPLDLLRQLTVHTVAKAYDYGPQNTRTGPAVRKDTATIDCHTELLADRLPDLSPLYGAVTQKILKSNK